MMEWFWKAIDWIEENWSAVCHFTSHPRGLLSSNWSGVGKRLKSVWECPYSVVRATCWLNRPSYGLLRLVEPRSLTHCSLSQVMESEEFMLLPANQLIDIISSDELNVRSEEQVFNAVMAWVKYSIQERRPQLPQVCGWTQQFLLLLYDPLILNIRDCHCSRRILSDGCGFHVFCRSCSTSVCHCSAPSSWWAPSGPTLSLRVTRSAGGCCLFTNHFNNSGGKMLLVLISTQEDF